MLTKPIVSISVAVAVMVVGMFCSLAAESAWGAQVVPPVALVPLNQIAVPEPPNLFQYVKNKSVAIRLGKAFFWDMQAGSDGVQACATCHFSAGADSRRKNTVHPGRDGLFQVRGPNDTLQPADFPFHLRQFPGDFQASAVVRDADDVVGSQGLRLTQFLDIAVGSPVDSGVAILDPVFAVNGSNMRQVTGRNAPSVINSVFNFANFWDGRASPFFNGSSPFGPLDPAAGVWYNVNGTLAKQKVSILFGSLASQATGPPLNEVEMSFRGRTFPQFGRKMLSLRPLGKQMVSPGDSVLGGISRGAVQADGTLGGSTGLATTYSQLIKDAFQDNLWSANLTTPDGFSQMEANFSLFWGLAIQLYEATLVSDDTPFDRFLGGDDTALTEQQQEGFNIFFGVGRCDLCHGGSELTTASVRNAAFINNATQALMEIMPVASGKQIIYDNGFNNTAVRKTGDDICRGGDSPFLNPLTAGNTPLSFSLQAELQAQGLLPFAAPVLPANIPASFPVANDGAFKVPGLRNVELTGPYFHNGATATLDDVVLFYTRGGNFPNANKANLDINIAEIPAMQNEPAVQAGMVAFLKSMTDERVRNESAPFDHPELFIPNGAPDDPASMLHLPATDENGQAPPGTLTITADKQGSQPVGTTVVFTADAGSTFYQYRFWLYDGANWTMVRNYGQSPSWTMAANAPAGNYVLAVDVRKSTAVYRDTVAYYSFSRTAPPATGVTVTADTNSPHAAGSAVTFTASGTGSSGYQYRFWLYGDTGWSMVQDYGVGSTWQMPAGTSAGEYVVAVDVRTQTGVYRDAVSYLKYTVTAPPATGVSITPDQASPHQAGSAVLFSAAGIGSSGYQYRFWLYDGSGWSMVQDYGSAAAWSLPAGSPAGSYVVAVDVRTDTGVYRDAVGYLSYTVQ